MADRTKLKSFALNCSLKGSDASETSSTDKMIEDLFAALEKHGVSGEVERAADYNIKPGVLSNEGEGDEWPELRSKLLAADIFILGTPIWLGQPSSIAKRVVERMDAFLSETDDAGRMPPAGKVAIVAVVGMARITATRRCSRRSTMSASPSRRIPGSTGSAKRWVTSTMST
jgi:multimeric flavodoxin WrbA